MTQSEVGIAEISVSLHVVKRLPDQPLLLQEALVRHQQVQVTLQRTALLTTAEGTGRRACESGATLCLIMVLKWLFLKKTEISPSVAVALSSHRP